MAGIPATAPDRVASSSDQTTGKETRPCILNPFASDRTAASGWTRTFPPRPRRACARSRPSTACGQRGLAPRSTRPRHVRPRAHTPADVKAVMDLRRKYPFMGKARIHAMLVRKGFTLSVSTVGRFLSRALARGAIRPASFGEGRVKPKRPRDFAAKWAKRWKYGSKASRPGELVQIDHMTYAVGGQSLKEFRAACPVSKFMAARVCSRATAGNAKRFLLDILGVLPFPLVSIQVDGGSEFMADFERAREELGIPLHVLPPRRPQWNGCVERANRSARAEFWSLYDGPLTVAPQPRPWPSTSSFSTTSARTRRSTTKPPTSTLSNWRPTDPTSPKGTEPVQVFKISWAAVYDLVVKVEIGNRSGRNDRGKRAGLCSRRINSIESCPVGNGVSNLEAV